MDNGKAERCRCVHERNIIQEHENVETNDHELDESGANWVGFEGTSAQA